MTDSTDSPCALVDTNVVVYAYDVHDPRKNGIARTLIERLSNQDRLILSTQVLNEFCSDMISQKRKNRRAPDQLIVILRELMATGQVVPIMPALTIRCLDAMPRNGLSFWDALIWSTAVENKVAVCESESSRPGDFGGG